jgi:hypothetical protein
MSGKRKIHDNCKFQWDASPRCCSPKKTCRFDGTSDEVFSSAPTIAGMERGTEQYDDG